MTAALILAMDRVQAEKASIGDIRSLTTTWGDFVLIQTIMFPLLVSLVGSSEANVGLMKEASAQLQRVLEPLRSEAERISPQ